MATAKATWGKTQESGPWGAAPSAVSPLTPALWSQGQLPVQQLGSGQKHVLPLEGSSQQSQHAPLWKERAKGGTSWGVEQGPWVRHSCISQRQMLTGQWELTGGGGIGSVVNDELQAQLHYSSFLLSLGYPNLKKTYKLGVMEMLTHPTGARCSVSVCVSAVWFFPCFIKGM